MDRINDTIEGEVRSHGLALQEFCDMEQLYKLLGNWSKSCGMATVIVDNEGNQVSEDFGMTEFCKTVQSCGKGLECCKKTWKSNLSGVYECPFGFWDFSIPIVLPDGQVLGKVLAGQALSVNQNEEDILQKTSELGIDDETIKDVLSRMHRKTNTEMQGAYALLNETLHFFIEKSYYIWKTSNDLKGTPTQKDKVLSQITQIMYSYNLTIDIAMGNYSLITGTGMERTVEEYKRHSNMSEITAFQERILHPFYLSRFNQLINFDSEKNDTSENGFRGTLSTPLSIPVMMNLNRPLAKLD